MITIILKATHIRRLLQEDPVLGLYDVRGNRVADRTAMNNGVLKNLQTGGVNEKRFLPRRRSPDFNCYPG
jgi:hypothetical protein